MLRLVLLTLLVPAASATCTQLGCWQVQDRDGDGTVDWVSASFAADHALTLNAWTDGENATALAVVSTEELVEPYHGAYARVHRGNATETAVVVFEGDEETGDREVARLP